VGSDKDQGHTPTAFVLVYCAAEQTKALFHRLIVAVVASHEMRAEIDEILFSSLGQAGGWRLASSRGDSESDRRPTELGT
jgi:hypothetical protein